MQLPTPNLVAASSSFTPWLFAAGFFAFRLLSLSWNTREFLVTMQKVSATPDATSTPL